MINIAVLYGEGINCDFETLEALNMALELKEIMGKAERVHINEFIRGKKSLEDYQMLVIPGGFLHGDEISAGKILANKLKTKLFEELDNFVRAEKLILGICNGFQVLVKYPMLPSSGEQKVTLTWNNSGRFEDRWVLLKVNQNSPCIYLKGIDKIYLPVRHAEGKFIAESNVLNELEKNNQIALRYVKEDQTPANQEFPWNPNGSMRDIAGICDKSGRVFGMMPHPEAFNSFYNHPNWTQIKMMRGIEEKGAGLKIFENGIEFLKENFI